MSPREVQARELARVPVGARVKVRGCPGLGAGTVTEHQTELLKVGQKAGEGIPLIGFATALVDFGRNGECEHWVESFNTHELVVLP